MILLPTNLLAIIKKPGFKGYCDAPNASAMNAVTPVFEIKKTAFVIDTQHLATTLGILQVTFHIVRNAQISRKNASCYT